MADPIRDPLLVEQHPQERETDHGQHRHERTRADEKCECRTAGQTEDGVQRLSGPEPGRIHVHVGPGQPRGQVVIDPQGPGDPVE